MQGTKNSAATSLCAEAIRSPLCSLVSTFVWLDCMAGPKHGWFSDPGTPE